MTDVKNDTNEERQVSMTKFKTYSTAKSCCADSLLVGNLCATYRTCPYCGWWKDDYTEEQDAEMCNLYGYKSSRHPDLAPSDSWWNFCDNCHIIFGYSWCMHVGSDEDSPDYALLIKGFTYKDTEYPDMMPTFKDTNDFLDNIMDYRLNIVCTCKGFHHDCKKYKYLIKEPNNCKISVFRKK